MSTDDRIPVLNNIVQAGKQRLIQDDAPIPDKNSRSTLTDEPATKTTPLSTTEINKPAAIQFTALVEHQDDVIDIQEKTLYAQAEILLGIIEEKLGIYLIRRRKEILDALVDQLRDQGSSTT
jgi:hypothetical protein